MNMKEQAEKIYNRPLSDEEKLKQLKELEVDCVNMIEAQDQNMQPEMKQRLSEGLRKVRDYIRLFE